MGVTVREKPKGSGVWWVFINHHGNRKSKKVGKDKRRANNIAKQLEARLVMKEFNLEEVKGPTFGMYADKWINNHVPVKCKTNTIRMYQLYLSAEILPCFGDKQADEITRFIVKDFLMKKSREGRSTPTVKKYQAVISGVMNLVVDDGLLPANPAHRLGRLSGKDHGQDTTGRKGKIVPLNKDELSLLLATFLERFPRHYPMALTLARTGMRLGEVIALKWDDIDFTGRFIMVQRSYSSGIEITTPKSGKYRRVNMSMQLTETLWILKRERERESGENMPEWVFPNEAGALIDQNLWRKRIFKKTLEEAELRAVRIHDLRHTFASLLLQSGAPMIFVKEQLGHSSIKVTVDIYGHLLQGGDNHAVDQLDDIDTSSAPIRTLCAPTKEKDSGVLS